MLKFPDISIRQLASKRTAGLLTLGLVAGIAFALEQANQDAALHFTRIHYGAQAVARVQNWFSLMLGAGQAGEREKLKQVNEFFNRIPNTSDQAQWGKSDYWATPLELIGANGGDCEDFALAKYFTLRDLGVPDERLRLTYVRAYLPASKEMQSHMVLTYHSAPDAEPLVLDNLTNAIKPASERKDLAPTYSFNGAQLWASKLRASGRLSEPAPANLWSMLRAHLVADEHAPQTTGEK